MSDTECPGVMTSYLKLLHSSNWQEDSAQKLGAKKLDELRKRLMKRKTLISRGWIERVRLWTNSPLRRKQGLYIYGPVGRGKSALMDIFFNSVPIEGKRRTHFHAFMLDVHSEIHKQRQDIRTKHNKSDPISGVAELISKQTTLLCFDEFQVNDPADAMILSRLFSELFGRGVVVVATSNRPPQSLYKGGLNRELFLPFIELLIQSVDLIALDGPLDYRLMRLRMTSVYFSPLSKDTQHKITKAFSDLTDGAITAPRILQIQGRNLTIPISSGGIACLTFDNLCRQPLGTADYIEIARQFHTLFIENIPIMESDERDEARRFINLIDILYEHRVNLICSAEGPPDTLYRAGHGVFEFARTVSRLMEMQSETYLASEHLC